MKKSEIKIGGFYIAKISGRIVTVKVLSIDKIKKQTNGGSRTKYFVRNLSTGYETIFRSAAKFRREVSEKKPQRVLIPDLKPTPRTSHPHIIVEALAGTGKTTTLVEGLKVLRGETSTFTPSVQQLAIWEAIQQTDKDASVCFVAFNKSIAQELEKRVPLGCDAMTMHSMGYKAVREKFGRVKVSSYRVQDIIAEILEMDSRELRKKKWDILKAVERLVGLCKMNLTDLSADAYIYHQLGQLASHYDIDLNGNSCQVFDIVPKVLERCLDVARDGCINFDDMIWLPVTLGLTIAKYDLLLVDEAQDLNKCQQTLAKRAGHRLVFCGDEKQAIYGFAGADSESMKRLKEELTATEEGCDVYPLTVTRRCGHAIVKEAQQYVPSFEAHETTPLGSVIKTTMKQYQQNVEIGDMILCRVNAPLVSQCFQFLKAGRKATIQGRDIAQSLTSTTKKMKATDIYDLQIKLQDWLDKEQANECKNRNPSESRMIALQDRYDCLLCFTENAETIDEVIRTIENIFTDEQHGNGILLSSIHRAKGLEANRVFLLQPKGATMPHPMAKSPWQLSQEYNLLYVAITRAIDELVYVS